MFIDPRTDLAFKKIFGSEDSQPILISFLNAILYQGDPTIVDLSITNPYAEPRHQGLKTSILDVKATLSTGERVIIEMQLINVEGFEKRVLYNAAKEYVNQLSSGSNYRGLQPVIALSIVNFTLFADERLQDKVVSFFRLLEKEEQVFYPDGEIELVFVELPKFTMPLEEVDTLTEKWIYFMKHAAALSVVPDTFKTEPAIQAAFDKARETGLSPEEAEIIEKEQFTVQDNQFLNEKLEQAEAEKQQAEAEKRQAEAKANEAEAKSQKLLAKLKELGIDPEDL